MQKICLLKNGYKMENCESKLLFFSQILLTNQNLGSAIFPTPYQKRNWGTRDKAYFFIE